MSYRIQVFSREGNLFISQKEENKHKADAIARKLMRSSTKVMIEVKKDDQHETPLQHRTPSQRP